MWKRTESTFHQSFSSRRTKRIEVNLSDLDELEAKKVESVLRRAEKIRGNGVLFEVSTWVDCQRLRCATSGGLRTKDLVSSLVNTALISPETTNPFASIRKKKNEENLRKWKPQLAKPLILEVPAERSSSELPNPFLSPKTGGISGNPFSPISTARIEREPAVNSPLILPITEGRLRINSISEVVDRKTVVENVAILKSDQNLNKQCEMGEINMQKTVRNASNLCAKSSAKCVNFICKKQCEMRQIYV